MENARDRQQQQKESLANEKNSSMLSLNDFLSVFQPHGNLDYTRNASKKYFKEDGDVKKKDIPEEDKKSTKKSNLKLVEKKEKSLIQLKRLSDEIIRPELNIEKHADFIFIPAHSRKVNQPRRREGWVELSDGTQEKSYLEISPIVGGKTPTTTTRKIYLALQRLYEEKEKEGKVRPDGSIIISSREIMRVAMLTLSGKNMHLVQNELRTLRTCAFEWANVFIAPDGKKYKLLATANILDKYEHVSKHERVTQEEIFQAAHKIRFGEYIIKNLDANKTKPVNYTTVMGIKGELALVLYTRLDIILADKEHYSRTSKGIFEDINLADEKEYKYPFGRKRRLERAIAELEGKCISTGLLKLRLEKTKDGADWKLVVRKIPVLPFDRKSHPRIAPANLPIMINCLAEDIAETIGSYEQKRRLYEAFAYHFPAEIIYQAISEYKADKHNVRNSVAFFTAILHRIAHQRGHEWIKPCDPCKYRPT